MGTQVRIGKAQPHDDVAIEDRDGHAAVAEMPENAGHRVTGADGVDQHPHLNATSCSSDRGIGNPQPDPVSIEDVGFEQDTALGSINRRLHRGVAVVARLDHVDRIAGGKWIAGHPVAERLQGREALAEAC